MNSAWHSSSLLQAINENDETSGEIQCSDKDVIKKYLRHQRIKNEFDCVYIDNQLQSIEHYLLIIVCSCRKRFGWENCCYGVYTFLKECEQLTSEYMNTDALCTIHGFLVVFISFVS